MRDIFFLTCGTHRIPAFAFAASDAKLRGLATLSVTVGVLVRDDGSVVLVDAGWSIDACARRSLASRLKGAMYLLVTREEDAIAMQLERLGIGRDRVKTIIATHLHLDHVGAARDFPNAELVCTAEELAAHRRRGIGYRSADIAKCGALRAVRLDQEPRHGFPGSLDLFEDGEVLLLDARGHTAGSTAVAIRNGAAGAGATMNDEPTYLHVGDAAYHLRELALGARPSLFARALAWNNDDLVRTHRTIAEAHLVEGAPLAIVPSHDHDVFDGLPHTPRRA